MKFLTPLLLTLFAIFALTTAIPDKCEPSCADKHSSCFTRGNDAKFCRNLLCYTHGFMCGNCPPCHNLPFPSFSSISTSTPTSSALSATPTSSTPSTFSKVIKPTPPTSTVSATIGFITPDSSSSSVSATMGTITSDKPQVTVAAGETFVRVATIVTPSGGFSPTLGTATGVETGW